MVGLSRHVVLSQVANAVLLPVSQDGPVEAPPVSADLDPSQKDAAEFSAFPVLVGAGPGTGKTKTLVGRCAHLVHSVGIPSESILALTFSNKAAEEMRGRLAAADVGTRDAGPWVGTFHGFGLEVLRRYGDRVGLPTDFKLLDRLDCITLLENNLSLLPLDALANLYNPALKLPGILKAISRAKDELCPTDHYAQLCADMRAGAEAAARTLAARTDKITAPEREAVEQQMDQAIRAGEVSACYAVYEGLLRRNGFVDFGDLIYLAVRILEEHPACLQELQRQFPQVLADEYQDVNRACTRLLRLLAGEGATGLWVVGDHLQSIYRFRGASAANVSLFTTLYATGRRKDLKRNYRSREPIVRLFSTAARAMGARGEEDGGFSDWEAHRGTTPVGSHAAVAIATADDAAAEATGIVRMAQSFCAAGWLFRDQTILCRSHNQAEALVSVLNAAGIPTLYLGDLFERTEIKDLLSVISLCSGGNGYEILRVASIPEYAIPASDALLIASHMEKHRLRFRAAAEDSRLVDQLSPAALPGVTALQRHLRSLASALGEPTTLLRRYLFEESDYLRNFWGRADDEFQSAQQLMAIHQLLRLASSFDRRIVAPVTHGAAEGPSADMEGEAGNGAGNQPPRTKTRDFLNHLQRMVATGEGLKGEVPDEAQSWNAMRIMTVHAAKGLEFPIVYVPNLASGRFPSKGTHDGVPEPPGLGDGNDAAVGEEACLFFVALSRAREHIVLSHARQYGVAGRAALRSPLVQLINDALNDPLVERLSWASGQSAKPAAAAMAARQGDLPLYLVSDLDAYLKCSRQYYYRRVAGVRGAWLGAGYQQFQSCLYQALGWIQSERKAGRRPDAVQAEAMLREAWVSSGPVGHVNEQKYLTAAVEMAERARSGAKDDEVAAEGIVAIAMLGNCRVSVEPDAAFNRSSDGALVLAKLFTGKPQELDPSANRRLSILYRAASDSYPDRLVSVEARFLADGSSKRFKPQAHHDKGRIEKYENAAVGLGSGVFAPNPASDQACQLCGFSLICPQRPKDTIEAA
nr:ATP-dependent DNA helicase [Capsulimonas corticalis]